jgi:hypothetical protein
MTGGFINFKTCLKSKLSPLKSNKKYKADYHTQIDVWDKSAAQYFRKKLENAPFQFGKYAKQAI